MKYTDTQDRPFNQAVLFVERLDKLEGMIDELISSNEVRLAFDLLKRVYVRIAPIVQDKSSEEIKELNKKIKDSIKKMQIMVNNHNNNNIELLKNDFFNLDKNLWELQHLLELVLPKRISKPWELEVESDFE